MFQGDVEVSSFPMTPHLAYEVLKIIGIDLKVTGSLCWFKCLTEILSFPTIPHMATLGVYESVTLRDLSDPDDLQCSSSNVS